MNDTNETVVIEIVYDPMTHKEKVQKVIELTTILKNAKTSKATMAVDLMNIFPRLKDAEDLIEYFAILRKHGIHFGAIIDKKTIKELEELQDVVNTIRQAARMEFRFRKTGNTSGR